MRSRDLVALEFPRVCARVADFAASVAGQQRCQALHPARERGTAEAALDRTAQMVDLLERHGDPPLRAFADVRADVGRAAHEGLALDGRALVAVRATLETLRLVGAYLRRHAESDGGLRALCADVVAFPQLERALHQALDEDGAVLDQASDALARVRSAIRRLRDSLTRKLEHLVQRHSMAEVMADSYVTLRNDRFVVPVRAGAAGQFPGVVQDRSASGETLFIEPLFAVELNNDLLLAVREEELIVQRILADLTGLVGAEHAAIARSVDALIDTDCLFACARFARAYRCTRPSFTDEEIALAAARHPGILCADRAVTPVDVQLPGDRATLVITGPNTGGKTVALKTLGLCALMAQSGLFIPAAEGARLPCFGAVFADVGDEQSIERNLSTFSAHVANLAEIAAAAAETPLILLDEPGIGTDPDDGAALAIALIEFFDERGARLAITTHYSPVKLFALDSPRCTVAAVDIDPDTFTPRYRLVYDSIGRSLALPIASRLGLPRPILDRAAGFQPESAQRLAAALDALERSRAQLEAERADLHSRAATVLARETESTRLAAELRERRRAAWATELREARAFVRTLKAEGQARLAELRDARERAAFGDFTRAQAAAIDAREAAVAEPEARAAAPAEPAGALRIGDLVAVRDRGIQGQLLAVDGARAWIQRGTLRFEVPTAHLRSLGREPAPPTAWMAVAPVPHDDSERELSLIGLRAREALDRLERFLDRAVQGGEATVRIIHGVGSGALRRAVHDYLAISPYCATFRGGESSEGGTGVTVATLQG